MHQAMILVIVLVAAARAQEQHELRLSNIGANMAKQGRVEVFNGDQWGTICPDGWDFYDALVVCKQLGFPWLSFRGWLHDAGTGVGPAWLSNVECKGSETGLDECVNDGWMEHQCTDTSRAAAVSCVNEEEFKGMNVHASLADGNTFNTYEGRVRLDLNIGDPSQLFLLCDQGWDMADAAVVCRQLGLISAERATTNSYFGEPNPRQNIKTSFLASDVACLGNESHILACPATAWFLDDCPGHNAGVVCKRIQEPEDFRVRLVNGSTPNEGRVEVYRNGTWGSVCVEDYSSRDFSINEGNVICNQLGLGYGLEAPKDGRFGRSLGPVAVSGYVDCGGGESSFAQCYYDPEPDQDCPNKDISYEATVICSGPIPASRSPTRLLNYSQREEGVVLIYHDGRWGTICGPNWTTSNSEVVCRELGFGPPEKYINYPVTGPIFVSNVSCMGNEDALDQCSRGEWYQHGCSHVTDVLLTCSPSEGRRLVSSALLTTLVILFSFPL